MSGLSRRFLNLILDNSMPGAKSLRCIDLTRHKLFKTTVPVLPLYGSRSEPEGPEDATPWCDNHKNKMGTIRLPAASINFRASAMGYYWYMQCFPLADRKLLCADPSGRTILFDAGTREVEYMPCLHSPKLVSFSIFTSSAGDNDGGSIYFMARCPDRELGGAIQLSHQFQAFVYRRPTLNSFTKSWQHQLLPPPPFTCDPKYYQHSRRPEISSYAVVEGGSQICISVDGAGTYCLDTVKHTWMQVGEWTLPFIGKVEYVPELKLWFGFSAKDWKLCAADLSTMDSQPQLVDTWNELEAPEEWTELRYPQLVNIGSGRFCTARFFHCLNPMAFFGPDPVEEFFTVLTGADVVPSCGSNGKVELKIVKHISRRHMSDGSDGTINLVF